MKFNYFLIVCFLIQFKLCATGQQHKFPRQIEAQPERIHHMRVFNPLSLKDLAYSFLDAFLKQASNEDQNILLTRINNELSPELIEEFADNCLDSPYIKKDLPFSNWQNFQISHNHQSMCTYEVQSLNESLFDIYVQNMVNISIYHYDEKLYSFVNYGILLSDVMLSPSGKNCAFVIYQNDCIKVKMHNIHTKATITVKDYVNNDLSAKIKFQDENTVIGCVGKFIFIYKIDNQNMYNFTDHLSSNFNDMILLQDRFFLYCRKDEPTVIIVYDLHISNVVKRLRQNKKISHLKKVDDRTIITADCKGLKIWHLDDNHLKKEKKIKLSGINALALDPSYSFVSVNYDKSSLSIWDLETCNLLYAIKPKYHRLFFHSGMHCQNMSWDLDNEEILLKESESRSQNLYAYTPKNLSLGLILKKFLIKKMQIQQCTNINCEEATKE